MELDIEQGIALIQKAREEETKRLLWEEWLTMRPYMDKDKFTTFEDFYKSRVRPKVTVSNRKSKEELLQEAEQIREKFRRG